MSEETALRDLVDRLYAARASGDVDAVMPFFHPDATFRIAGAAAASPVAMRAEGVEAIRAAVEQLVGFWAFLDRKELAFVAGRDTAAVHSSVTMRFVPSGETVETEFNDLWTFRDGKVVSLAQFIDTALASAVIARAGADKLGTQ